MYTLYNHVMQNVHFGEDKQCSLDQSSNILAPII